MSTRAAQISANLSAVKKRIATASRETGRHLDDVTLIIVTKLFPVSDMEILYELGERNFGENRDQEGSAKSKLLPSDIHWHFQGQIQSNKIKSITQWAEVIHSLDDLAHARKIETSCSKSISAFVQVNLDTGAVSESGRGGVVPENLPFFLSEVHKLRNIHMLGLMTVAPLDSRADETFNQLQSLQQRYISDYPHLTAISAGMSGDFEAAIRFGATHVRIGSSILGHR